MDDIEFPQPFMNTKILDFKLQKKTCRSYGRMEKIVEAVDRLFDCKKSVKSFKTSQNTTTFPN